MWYLPETVSVYCTLPDVRTVSRHQEVIEILLVDGQEDVGEVVDVAPASSATDASEYEEVLEGEKDVEEVFDDTRW